MLAVLLGWGLSLGGLPAHAARAVDEVSQLLDQGNTRQAAKQADSYLKQNPSDVEMRFLRGVIATEQKDNAQAVKIFSALVREHPGMPEPYNNLAVLYAAQGQERKAAEALEQAIRTNPSYTTAHENLGDLYARMASEAYTKALQLDGSRQAIPAKLALITQLVPSQQAAAKTVLAAQAATGAPAAAAPTPAPAKPAEPKVEPKVEKKPVAVEPKPVPPVDAKPAARSAPVTVAAAPVAAPAPAPAPTPAPAPVSAPAAPAPSPAAPAPAPVAAAPAVRSAEPGVQPKPVAAAPAPVAKAATPAPEPKPAAAPAVAEIESAVKDWADAWEKQDMPRYLAAYSERFEPANRVSLAQWKEARRVRIVGKSDISIKLQNIQVAVDGDQATAKFRQNYVAGSLNTTTRKTLSLRHEGGHWRIVRETTGG
ncbi:tetratricopeptide repeat protein [Comamonas antarctica]|uniref:nuclear transport factor 2 family protein n=1 Tax=Comamonas antarctica TaxID=2743470 RepID=UPI0028E39028|nr:tetratricopeptide repeat protein [Comamonas antarctica]